MTLITSNKLVKKVNEGIQVFHMSIRYMFGRKINFVSELTSVLRWLNLNVGDLLFLIII